MIINSLQLAKTLSNALQTACELQKVEKRLKICRVCFAYVNYNVYTCIVI